MSCPSGKSDMRQIGDDSCIHDCKAIVLEIDQAGHDKRIPSLSREEKELLIPLDFL